MSTPIDRTTKQPLTWRCSYEECLVLRRPFEFQSDQGVCPKCGQTNVTLLTLIHLIVPHLTGPIVGKKGRYFMACSPARVRLATKTNKEAATNLPSVVNCPGCVTWMGMMKIPTRMDRALLLSEIRK